MIALTTEPNTASKVSSAAVKSGMSDTMKASTLMQLYANTINQTPDINLPSEVDTDSNSSVSKDLPNHQAKARANATGYLNTINPLMVKTLSDIIGFSNQWTAFFDRLMTLAQSINEGNNKEIFQQGVLALQNVIQKKGDSTVPVINALNDFLAKIQEDQRNFNRDHDLVTAALGGESGEIATLKANIDSLYKAIGKDNAMIAGGATGEVVGIVMISVGVLAEIETAGASTALIVGGLAVMGGSSAMIGIAAKDLAGKQNQLKADTAKLTNLEQLYTCVNTSNNTIQSMVDAISGAIAAVESLQKGWNSLHDGFGEINSALGLATPDLGDWLVDQLNTANKDWQDTRTLALHLQDNGTIPIQKTDMTQPNTTFALAWLN
ncbi:MAG TPA: HBL/NHE enterotoxin family protein [Chroococcales cyanobacterium]|jgi:non-hemolytic enterotoxin B/C